MTTAPKRLNVFERYLTLWVGLCMILGVALGKAAPQAMDILRGMEFGGGSRINIPISVLLWLMIYPMMLKVDFGSILSVGRKPKGLLITLCHRCRSARRGSCHAIRLRLLSQYQALVRLF